MYIIGIDIGKNHHEASIVSPEGKQIGHSLRFATTHKGADSLMSFIFNNIGNSSCIFGMEATGHYWYPIYSFLKARGYTIYVINPIQSDSLRKMYIRQTKNDSIDSFLIAEVIRFGQFTTTSQKMSLTNASNGSAGAKPVRNPEREKPKWEDTITNRMLHWSYTPEQKEEVKKALAAEVPKATILTYFYPEVSVERISSYRKKH